MSFMTLNHSRPPIVTSLSGITLARPPTLISLPSRPAQTVLAPTPVLLPAPQLVVPHPHLGEGEPLRTNVGRGNRFSLPPDSSTGTSDTSTPSDSNTSSGLPTATRSTPIGAIVGGVVGGIAGVVILTLALLWCFLRKRSRGGRAYYFEKPTPVDILAGEGL